MTDLWSDERKARSPTGQHTPLGCGDCPAWGNGICGKHAAFAQDRLADLAHPETVGRGSLIIEEGALAADVFTLRQGCVRLFNLLPDGRRHVLGFLFPGDFIGLGLGETYAFSAQAIRKVTFCRFHRSSFDRVVREQADLAAALAGRVAEDLNQTRAQLMVLGRKTAEERLASLLIWLAAKTHGGCALHTAKGKEIVKLPMSRADIADYLGITTETVSRLFTRFRSRNLLTSQGPSQVTLVDPVGMRALAAGYAAGDND
ncbi:MAG: Crp/Fnr family transcriptional regulator [Alphaproteobacteria bacterium]|nr:Crp/Fnr family transcriptional regulator [Alphaproteobacteria bacterium]